MAGKRLALLIANGDYQHPELRKLNAPIHDVRTLEALLRRPDVGRYQTEVLVDGIKRAVERAIDQLLIDGASDDTVLIFFAGHGLKHENGMLYFAAADTEPQLLGGTAIWASCTTSCSSPQESVFEAVKNARSSSSARMAQPSS
jgi:Caspase domain